MKEETPPRRTVWIAPAVGVALLALLGALHLSWLWRGPSGIDGIAYARMALLEKLEPSVALRYGFVYSLAALRWLTGSAVFGSGLLALLSYLGLVGLAFHIGLRAKGIRGALAAAFTVALCPIFLDGATVPYCDTPAAFLAGLSIVLAEEGGRRFAPLLFVLSGVAFGAALRSRETTICAAAGVLVVLWSQRDRAGVRNTGWWLAGACAACGIVLLIDWAVTGNVLFALGVRTGKSYLAYNLRPHDPDFSGGVLTDPLVTRWMVPFGLIALAGAVKGLRYPLAKPFAAWAATSALFTSWALSIGGFGANERYVYPLLTALLPFGAVWLLEEIVEFRPFRRENLPSLALLTGACGVAALLGMALSDHFGRKSFHQVLPVAWSVVVAGLLAGLPGPMLRAALAALSLLSAGASVYTARQMAISSQSCAAEWTQLARVLGSSAGPQVGVMTELATTAATTESHLAVFSDGKNPTLVRLGSALTNAPFRVLCDPSAARALKAAGYRRVMDFGPPNSAPLVLFEFQSEVGDSRAGGVR